MKRWWFYLGLIAAWMPVMAQGPAALPVPPRPPGGILDDARLFSTEPSRLEALEQRVGKVSAESGLPIYVVFYGSLIGRTMGEEVVRLQEAWLGSQPGVLLVVETGNGQFWLNWAEGDSIESDGQHPIPVLRGGMVPPQDQLMIDQQIQDLGRMPTGSMDHAEKMIGVLLDGIEGSVLHDAEGPTGRWKVVVLGLAIAGLALGGGLLLLRWMKGADARAAERFVFPELRIEKRLGAPFCGGRIREKSFRSSASG
ncbi:hypothetical protein [Haloferula sargassicola]